MKINTRHGKRATDRLLIKLMSRLGKKKSPAKAAASKLNGAKGGRPRINKVDTP